MALEAVPEVATVSTGHMGMRMLRAKALGMDQRDVLLLLYRVPVVFLWDDECAPPWLHAAPMCILRAPPAPLRWGCTCPAVARCVLLSLCCSGLPCNWPAVPCRLCSGAAGKGPISVCPGSLPHERRPADGGLEAARCTPAV